MSVDYSDEAVATKAAAYERGERDGDSRAAHYLRAVPAEHRAAVVSAATIRTNMSGGLYADNVSVISQGWQRYVTPEAQAADRALARGTYTEANLPGSGGHGFM